MHFSQAQTVRRPNTHLDYWHTRLHTFEKSNQKSCHGRLCFERRDIGCAHHHWLLGLFWFSRLNNFSSVSNLLVSPKWPNYLLTSVRLNVLSLEVAAPQACSARRFVVGSFVYALMKFDLCWHLTSRDEMIQVQMFLGTIITVKAASFWVKLFVIL